MKASANLIGIVISIVGILVSLTIPEIRNLVGLSSTIKDSTVNASSQPQPQPLEEPVILKPTASQEIDIKIVDKITGKRDSKFENYFNEIVIGLGVEAIEMKGEKNITIIQNKTIPDEVRAEIELGIVVDGKVVSLPVMYGRGHSRNAAVNHGLSFNKNIIVSRIRGIQ